MKLPSLDTLEKALVIRREIDTLEGSYRKLFNGETPSRSTHLPRARHRISKAGRARIAAAARARWAKVRAKKEAAKKS
jgi:hypothetical protein